MSIRNTASPMLQHTMMSASSSGLGNLIKLPREIRDEIYRHLLKGHYRFEDNSRRMRPRTQKPNLTLFSVSRATYDESSSVLYSESVFRFALDRVRGGFNPTMYPPEPTVRRMMKIEVVFDCCGCWHQVCSDTLNALNIRRVLRDSLTVICHIGPLKIGEELIGRLSKELDAFRSFRTVTLKLNPDRNSPTRPYDGESRYITRVAK